MNQKKLLSISDDVLAAAEEEAVRICLQLDDKPEIADLLTEQEIQDGAPFYFMLREFVQQLKAARVEANLTLADVSTLSGLAIESLSRLETGANGNPTWKTLGLYAKAVQRRPSLVALPLISPVLKPASKVASNSATNAEAFDPH